MIIYKQFDIVKLPFPFTDKKAEKKRPALIISKPSYQENHHHCIFTMITSAKQSQWVDDVVISDLALAGLPSDSKVRFKIFSLHTSLIIGYLGKLPKPDIMTVRQHLNKYII